MPDSAAAARRPRRWAPWLVVALLAALAMPSVRRGWHATRLREAYIGELAEASQREPRDPDLLMLLGARLSEAGHPDEAAWVLSQAIRRGGALPEVWLLWAASEA